MQLIISIYYAFQITVIWLWVSAQVTLDAPIQSGGLSFQTRSNALSTGWLTRYHWTETSWGAAQWKADESKSQDFVVESNLFLPALLALHLVLTYEARVHWLAQPTMLLLISFLYQEDFGVDEGQAHLLTRPLVPMRDRLTIFLYWKPGNSTTFFWLSRS